VRGLQQIIGGFGITIVNVQLSSMNAVTEQSFYTKLARSSASRVGVQNKQTGAMASAEQS